MNVERLRGLVVSVQAESGSHLNTPQTIAVLAQVAEDNGAVAVRIEGAARIAAVRSAVGLPIIGIVKRAYDGFAPYITAGLREVSEIADGGADIVAFDATFRERPGGITVEALVNAIAARGLLAMADCSAADEARAARAAGASIVATTLCGYTPATHGQTLPALGFVRAIAADGFTICEGGVGSPADVNFAFQAGADAVVVGTAITNIDVLVRRFVGAVPKPA